MASFGDHQELSFKLKTRLENSEILRKVFILNLPPDTSKQQVVFKKITPKPNKIEVDKFGNYQAMFEVRSRGNVDVTIEGVVKIAGSNKFYPKKKKLPELRCHRCWYRRHIRHQLLK